VSVYSIKSNGECNFAIPSEAQVSIGMLQTSCLSFGVGRTECVGQTMFPICSMMIPVSNQFSSSGQQLRTSDHHFPPSKCMCFCLCVHVLSAVFLTLMFQVIHLEHSNLDVLSVRVFHVENG